MQIAEARACEPMCMSNIVMPRANGSQTIALLIFSLLGYYTHTCSGATSKTDVVRTNGSPCRTLCGATVLKPQLNALCPGWADAHTCCTLHGGRTVNTEHTPDHSHMITGDDDDDDESAARTCVVSAACARVVRPNVTINTTLYRTCHTYTHYHTGNNNVDTF